ncbi:MAG: alkaline phosphatase family protein [Nitrospira sp.]|jgi:predicted AlkP superfamily phosphohydrolase/phosphomutase
MAEQAQRQKVMGIGLDGVPSSLLRQYLEQGILPGFHEILTQGYRLHQMHVSIPEISSTCWTSFMTGVNPGEHGIYGFMDLRPQSYTLFFPSAHDVQAPTMWDIAGGTQQGRTSSLAAQFAGAFSEPLRSVVLNIPQTYPARAINGVLTAGFVCPDLQRGTYPERAYQYLKSIDYMPDVDAGKAITDKPAFLKEVQYALDRREEAFLHFLEREEWDMFLGVITETDRLQHFFFDAARNAEHPYHEAFLDVYRRVDRIVGRLFHRFMDLTHGEGVFLTMSDHGFTVLHQEVNLNAWLQQNGWLHLRDQGQWFDRIATDTRVFAMDPGRFFVHTEGRYPRGSVKGADKPIVLAELTRMLDGLTGPDGRRVIRDIYLGESLYRGQAMSMAPDLVCVPNDGYDLKANVTQPVTFRKGPMTGMHTQYDGHCLLPESLSVDGQLHIEQLAGMILGCLTKTCSVSC